MDRSKVQAGSRELTTGLLQVRALVACDRRRKTASDEAGAEHLSAAGRLRIRPTTLYARIKRLEIDASQFKSP